MKCRGSVHRKAPHVKARPHRQVQKENKLSFGNLEVDSYPHATRRPVEQILTF
jgi:hypothetical protein